MTKNLPLSSVNLLASFFISVIITSVIYFFCYVTITPITPFSVTAIFLLSFTVVYFIFRWIMKKYFVENLKDIYLNIESATGISKLHAKSELKDKKIIPEIFHIIDDWKKDQAKEIDKLKQLELYRKEFLGNVSHELKTPIFNVQGYIHTLIDGGIEDADVNTHYLNKASKSLDRLISIVDDLNSISKLEAGKLIIEPRTFDIYELAKEIIESLDIQAKEKHIHLRIRENSAKPFYVFADKERIRQVLVNLLVNSIKYGKENGETEISFSERTDAILIDVSDNGIGIDKEHLPRLFERFYRVDKSRSREQGGTGLGLAIVKHIIEAHEQKISVTSQFGYGTVFSFTLARSK